MHNTGDMTANSDECPSGDPIDSEEFNSEASVRME